MFICPFFSLSLSTNNLSIYLPYVYVCSIVFTYGPFHTYFFPSIYVAPASKRLHAALLLMREGLSLSARLQNNDNEMAGSLAIIAGWGTLYEDGPVPPSLMKTQVVCMLCALCVCVVRVRVVCMLCAFCVLRVCCVGCM